jgi:hypothetical protein
VASLLNLEMRSVRDLVLCFLAHSRTMNISSLLQLEFRSMFGFVVGDVELAQRVLD